MIIGRVEGDLSLTTVQRVGRGLRAPRDCAEAFDALMEVGVVLAHAAAHPMGASLRARFLAPAGVTPAAVMAARERFRTRCLKGSI